jgi:hypothetical protein
MKIIKNVSNILDVIFGEMSNVQNNVQMYENGVEIKPDYSKPYLSFIDQNISYDFQAVSGSIFIDSRYVTKEFQALLEDMCKKIVSHSRYVQHYQSIYTANRTNKTGHIDWKIIKLHEIKLDCNLENYESIISTHIASILIDIDDIIDLPHLTTTYNLKLENFKKYKYLIPHNIVISSDLMSIILNTQSKAPGYNIKHKYVLDTKLDDVKLKPVHNNGKWYYDICAHCKQKLYGKNYVLQCPNVDVLDKFMYGICPPCMHYKLALLQKHFGIINVVEFPTSNLDMIYQNYESSPLDKTILSIYLTILENNISYTEINNCLQKNNYVRISDYIIVKQTMSEYLCDPWLLDIIQKENLKVSLISQI